MAHTNSTTHYSLPQFESSDKPAWLTDINGAFSAIDTGIYNAQDKADDAATDAAQALEDAAAAASTASGADTKGAGAVASIAPAFDSTSTYAVGDLVMYNSLLYRCKEAVVVPGAWTGTTNWARRTLDDQIPQILSNLRDVNIGNAENGDVLAYNDSTGKWYPNKNPKNNITSSVSFNENYSHAYFYVREKIVFFTYQGENKAHSANDEIFTIPSAYRPATSQYIPFVGNALLFGNITIGTDGHAVINQISDSSSSARIYMSGSYPL